MYIIKNRLNIEIKNLKNSIITEFAENAKNIPNCINLTYGEPDFFTPEIIKEKAIEGINNNITKYEKARGNTLLINKILNYELTNNNYSYTNKEIIITNGATEAIYLALCTILNKNDEVIIPCPYYPEYIPVINRCCAKEVIYNNEEFNYQLDYNSLEKLITENTKCLILNSPNNPTGIILNENSINIAYKLVKKYNIYLLLDNCYEQLIFNNKTNFSKYNDIKDNILICQSFSKTYSMTGWRLGYLLGPKEIIDNALKLHQYLNVSVTSFVQYAALVAYEYNPFKEITKYKENIDYVYNRLVNLNLEVVKPDGAFYLFPSIKNLKMDSYTFCKKLLNEKHVAVTPGVAFGCDNNFRISCSIDMNKLITALDKIETFIEEIKKELF